MSSSAFDLQAAASTVAQSLAPRPLAARTQAASSQATGSTASTSATGAGDISSDDFLTLLVTEMKNQDPTQPTDPNAYIQQLVGVNSLQQLIAIDKDLTPPAASGSATSANGASSPVISSL